jgi:uncharacterized membrane protein YfcA
MFGIPESELIWLAVGLLAAGAVTGVLAGLFGIGGGGIIVPVLYQVFTMLNVSEDVRMPLAVGSSLLIIIPTSLSSFRAHYARGAVDMKMLRVWWWPIMLGVAVSSVIASVAPAELFKLFFVIVASIICFRFLSGWDLKFAEKLPGPPLIQFIGFFIGLCATLMGIAGGAFVNIAMTSCGRTMHQAVATASGVGIFIALPGAIGYMLAGLPHAASLPPFSIGYVSLIGFLLIAPTSMLLAPVGARLAHGLSKRTLEIGFGLFLLVITLRFVVDLIW